MTPTAAPMDAAPATAPVDPTAAMPGFQIDPGIDISDPNADSDFDGLTNQFESMMKSNPTVADTDMDGLTDGFEASIGSDATKMDTDLDGFTDGMEVHFGTNPLVADPMGSPMGPSTGSPMGPSMGSPLGDTLPATADPSALPDDDHALGADVGADLH